LSVFFFSSSLSPLQLLSSLLSKKFNIQKKLLESYYIYLIIEEKKNHDILNKVKPTP
jgi:hypothetical protein